MNCSEFLVDYLIKHGVTDVFGYAGGYIVPFMDALYKRKLVHWLQMDMPVQVGK